MMMFSFEVDTLEISLREQLDWVDMVFLVEASTTTKGVRKYQKEISQKHRYITAKFKRINCTKDEKPLLWERLKTTSRFKFVKSSKIVHVVMDDVIDLKKVKSDYW